MADIQINVAAGTQTRLLTAQKYCPSDILVTASGGSDNDANQIIERSIAGNYRNDTVTKIGSYVFIGCNITGVYFPNVESIQSASFQNCLSLSSVYTPKCQSVGAQAFYQCFLMQTLSLPAIRSISYQSFYQVGLKNLILSGENMCSLSNANAFGGTPIASGTGYIYVPDGLVAQYKAATNWSVYTAQIRGLSEIPPEVQEWLDQQEAA